MCGQQVEIIETRETMFFSYDGGKLRQWAMVTVESRLGCVAKGVVGITAGGEEVLTAVEVAPGVAEYRCYAPTLWPDRAPVAQAPVRLSIEGQGVTATVSVGNHRPWTIYVLADSCIDYVWVSDEPRTTHRRSAEMLEAEIEMIEATGGKSEANRNRYNMVVAREVEFYLEFHPQDAKRLFDYIRQGVITLNPFYNNTLTGDMSLEELVRQFYPARRWALEEGLDIGYANHQETPSMTWAMPTVLAGSGMDHLVSAILPYECPWAKRLEEPPIFYWEGPDGSRVLYRRRNEDYVEAKFLLRDLRATNTALHTRTIPAYEGMGQGYPFDAIGLLGCYGDLGPRKTEDVPTKLAAIEAYNAQGWEYPKLVSACHKHFWDDIDGQIASRQIKLPVYRGDYGIGWDAWPACLAHALAGWRRAQERAGVADKLSAILSVLEPEWYEAHQQGLHTAWMNLIYLPDHAWNGNSDMCIKITSTLRRGWQAEANRGFDSIINDGLVRLGESIPTEGEERVLVFNGLGWERTGLVRVTGIGQDRRISDPASGEDVVTQVAEEDGQQVVYFEGRGVPSVGYRTFAVRSGPAERGGGSPFKAEGCKLEGPFYRVEVSPITGGIISVYDKVRGKELVDGNSPYHLNQCVYHSEGTEHTPRAAQVKIGSCGPLFCQLLVRAQLKNMSLISTITVYATLDRIDIHNEVEKRPSREKQELDFAFPFQVPNRQYRYEAPGAIIRPGSDQLPGSGQAVTAVRHFVDIFNDEFGVTLSQADSGFIEFGHRTTTEDPLGPDPTNSTVLAMAFGNLMDWDEVTRDQDGQRHFVYRYSLRGHGGGFDPILALRFGWEDNNALEARLLPAGQKGSLPAEAHSFVQVGPESVLLTCLKAAEEEGVIVRLWECSGTDAEASLTVSGLGKLRAAIETDLLERDRETLAVSDGQMRVRVRGGGLATVRLLVE